MYVFIMCSRSLGAVHDGDDNSCRKTDYFIMTSENAVMPGPTAKNPWLFSACSGSEIRNKLTQLDRWVKYNRTSTKYT